MGGEGEKHKKISWIDGHDIKPPLASSFYYTPSVVPPSSFFFSCPFGRTTASHNPFIHSHASKVGGRGGGGNRGGNLPSKAWKDGGKIEGGGGERALFCMRIDKFPPKVKVVKEIRHFQNVGRRGKNHRRTLDNTFRKAFDRSH